MEVRRFVEDDRPSATELLSPTWDRPAGRGCGRLRVVTTNDNLDALRFYQKAGFRLVELRPGAVDKSGATPKPGIPPDKAPRPIRDEPELEKLV